MDAHVPDVLNNRANQPQHRMLKGHNRSCRILMGEQYDDIGYCLTLHMVVGAAISTLGIRLLTGHYHGLPHRICFNTEEL